MTTFPIDPLFTEKSRCKNCAAFSDYRCHRNPPIPSDDGEVSFWPLTNPNRFCLGWVATHEARRAYFSKMPTSLELSREPNPKSPEALP